MHEGSPSSYSLTRLLGALANIPANVAVVRGPEHVYAFANDAYMADMGITDPIGKPFGASNHPAILLLRSALDGVYATGVPWTAKEVLTVGIGKKGENRYFNLNLSPLRGDGNTVDGVLVHAYDVTELVRARQALRESEASLRMAVEASGIGLWSWDLQADRVLWEPQLSAIFGLPRGTAPDGQAGFLALVHPDDRDRVAGDIARGVVSGGWEDEYRIIRPDGAVRWILAKGSVLRREGGNIVLGAVMDGTDRQQRDEELRAAQKLEAVGQLTAGIAHNFNNMLMGVMPNLALALKDAPPALVPFLRDAERATERAADLVRQLMTYAGRNRPAARRVESLASLAERTLAICRTTFDRGITFETRFEGEALARVDASQIEQALLNLLINARDALAASRTQAPRVTVEIGVVRAGSAELAGRSRLPEFDYARIRVADNGIGMDAATLARIYEPFFTTKGAGRGTGLGLATTDSIVRDHGGWLTCESAPAEGATFSLYLPCEAKTSAGPPPLEPLSGGGTETVLIVDDEPSIRRVVALILESAGYTALAAASGQDATRLLLEADTAAKVALILLDVSMPGMPTRDLRRHLSELAPHARVVYFTGYAFEATGTDDVVLEKPVSQSKLLHTVRDALDRRAR